MDPIVDGVLVIALGVNGLQKRLKFEYQVVSGT